MSKTKPGKNSYCPELVSIFTVRNEVAKVMFIQVCVCPQGRVLGLGGVPGTGGGSALLLGVGVPGLGGGLLWGGGAWSGGVCSGGGGGDIPACTEADPREERLLLRTVRILLKCILVFIKCFLFIIMSIENIQ